MSSGEQVRTLDRELIGTLVLDAAGLRGHDGELAQGFLDLRDQAVRSGDELLKLLELLAVVPDHGDGLLGLLAGLIGTLGLAAAVLAGAVRERVHRAGSR